MRELCKGLGIYKARTTPSHSRCNGCAERWYRSLNAMLGKIVSTHQTDWPEHLPYVVNAYNTTVHSSTGFSPFFLMYGREQKTPLDIALGNPRHKAVNHSEYAAIMLDRLHDVYDLARDVLKKSAERAKKNYDPKVRVQKYQIGDKVWLLNPMNFKGRSPKWERRY